MAKVGDDKIMGMLFIDGEYLRKSIPLEDLKNLIISAFGIINYPEKIIYYSASLDNQQRKILSQIKNMEINDKGYIANYKDGKKVQKAVDGYIIVDIVEYSKNKDIKDINVIAGDGDLLVAFERSSSNNKKIKLIARKESVAEKLVEYSEVFYIEDMINKSLKNVEEKAIDCSQQENDLLNINCEEKIELNENEMNLKNLWEKECDNKRWISSRKIGRKRIEYNFKYSKGNLNKILKSLEERGIIEVRPKNGRKTSGYDVKFLL